MRFLPVVVLLVFSCLSLSALAQSEVNINAHDSAANRLRRVMVDSQGRLVVTSTAPDGGVTVTYVTPATCNRANSVDSVTSVGTTSTLVPATDAANRYSILVCNSAENSGVPLVKCRSDGSDAGMGITAAGTVLEIGDCMLSTSTKLRCISDTASTAVSSFQCVP